MSDHLELVVMIASYYRQRLDDMQVSMYAEDLSHIPVPVLVDAFKTYRQDRANEFMPMPGQLLAIADPKPDDRDEAVDLAVRMMTAVEKHDYTWANTHGVPWPQALIAELGTTAHQLIERWGGWKVFCNSYWETDRGIFRAQLRDTIVSASKRVEQREAQLRIGEARRLAIGNSGAT